MNIRVVVPLLTVLALAACSSDADKTADLKQHLADQWSFSPDYSAVKTADITYADGKVTVKTAEHIGATQAQEICGWVSDWLYDGSHGDNASIRVVLADNGDTVSQRKHANDVCSFGAGN